MYQDVLRAKRYIHHISRFPLPFPMTVLGLLVASTLLILMFMFVDLHPFFHVFIPLGVGALITFYEPEGINGFQYLWALTRKQFRPSRRVGNRAVTLYKSNRYKQCHTLTRIERGTSNDLVCTNRSA